jgi:membrane-associated protein
LETGLVVTPFLPGDSLLFATGAFAAQGSLNVILVCFLLTIAAILGDTVNYHIGKFLGPKVFESKWINKDYLEHTHKFYEKHGKKTIFLARFVPIIRTFAPFIAGVGTMEYSTFITYNIAGALAWVFTFVFSGYFFGSIQIIKDNFTAVILGIIVASFVPAVVEYVKHKKSSRRPPETFISK